MSANNIYHRFCWYATLKNKTPVETFPKFLSVLHVIDRSDWNPPIAATSVTSNLLYVMLSGCDWWISIWSVNNTQDWWKFWKRFRRCFFQNHISTKKVVTEGKGKLKFTGILVKWISSLFFSFSLMNPLLTRLVGQGACIWLETGWIRFLCVNTEWCRCELHIIPQLNFSIQPFFSHAWSIK